ncbi:hypothetical protein DZC30_17920 [Comamonas testosteroni]|uniref:Transmembrane protein n=1 Tax=Comamonas testosteroni TaxID=285 RepID=A0A373FCJ6_COMTE|nr:hypothetical protein [Comamonas testosteroni]RGE41858.1 hypothetical protein DZC30_17920 [Comamonas testosteroni]
MQIPQYWAQARLRHSTGIRHGATVQRWGWSDISQDDAQAHAQQRAEQALDAVLKAPSWRHLGRDFERIEWTGEYGLDGATPIREEVLKRRGSTVMTRNSYGAHCLNTEQVAIADIDYPPEKRQPRFPLFSLIVILAALPWLLATPLVWSPAQIVIIVLVAAMGLRFQAGLKRWIQARQTQQIQPASTTAQAMNRVQQVQARHPDWGLRVYQTPKGLRIIVTHAPWGWQSPEVQTLFHELEVDPIYALLCSRQQCFRARVSGKPWRMEMNGPSTPERRWPVQPENLPARQQWNQAYDQKSGQFAACHFLEQMGNPVLCAEAQEFIQWHDSACNAYSDLPLA